MPTDCFLCNPDPRLIVRAQPMTFTMVGLGPITGTYCVLAARSHIRSLADLYLETPDSIGEIITARDALERTEGPLLLTEHGRVPLCRDDSDQHEQHCFHAHGLLFSSRMDISDQARTYYGEEAIFDRLDAALAYATRTEHYLLMSPSPGRYMILSQPRNAPRQLTRTLVAISEGLPHLADWRASPRLEEALAMADALRQKGDE